MLQSLLKEMLYPLPQLILHLEQELEVVLISLTYPQYLSIPHKTPEFKGRIELDGLSENEVVVDLW